MRLRVPPPDAGRRLDGWLAEQEPSVSRSQVRRWIDAGRVTVEGRPAKAGHALRAGEEVAWSPPPADGAAGEPDAEDLPLDLLYVDDELAVVNKAAGMVVHPGAGVRAGTLVGALKGRGVSLARLGGPFRPGIVHRLDRDTSGLLVVARTDRAYAALVRALAARTIERHYRAVIWGAPEGEEGVIEEAIGRSRSDRQKMTVVRQGGRPALTRWRVRRRFRLLADVEMKLGTGRTHQIRVHWRHAGHPVFGDPDYGGRTRGGELSVSDRARVRSWLGLIHRQALHAARLEFDHPVTGRRLDFSAPLPQDMADLLSALEADSRPHRESSGHETHTA